MKRYIVWLSISMICVSLCLVGMRAWAGDKSRDTQKEEEAVKAAQTWLKLVDREKYEDSWETAASYFRNAVKKDQWIQSMNGVRKPLGQVLSREVISKKYVTSLPGAPDGEYVVIQFRTSFEKKKDAVETVTPMLDKDKIWRVSGYYIK